MPSTRNDVVDTIVDAASPYDDRVRLGTVFAFAEDAITEAETNVKASNVRVRVPAFIRIPQTEHH